MAMRAQQVALVSRSQSPLTHIWNGRLRSGEYSALVLCQVTRRLLRMVLHDVGLVSLTCPHALHRLQLPHNLPLLLYLSLRHGKILTIKCQN